MRVPVVGAGVIGNFNAARLKEAGQDVTRLARGRRLAEYQGSRRAAQSGDQKIGHFSAAISMTFSA
jgi:ketopantoate reductase